MARFSFIAKTFL